jgi:alpha-tubulin suppressor-like RCC1 family protein
MGAFRRALSAGRRGPRLALALLALALTALAAAGPALATSKPVITEQPVSVNVEAGQPATFKAAATGSPTPTVQWEIEYYEGGEWTAISKATSDSYTYTKTEDGKLYFRAKFRSGSAESITTTATLSVTEKPTVTENPMNKNVGLGQTARFEAYARAYPFPSAQWEISTDGGAEWSVLAGETHLYLEVTPEEESDNGREYRARFTNLDGSVVTTAATLTVGVIAEVTKQPQEQTVAAGTTATFESASAHGFPAPSVQWEVSSDEGTTWSSVPGASADVLTIPSIPPTDSYNEYRAAFSNATGTAYSHPATLYVAAGYYTAFGWGLNSHGQTGVGSSETSITAPLPINGMTFVTALAGGQRHSLALLANGTVESWGYNGHGQLGNAGAEGSDAPMLIEHLDDVKAIAAGGNHSLALLRNGTVMAWGDDEEGQLGDGANVDSEVPVRVVGLTGVIAIAAGAEHSLALLSNGTVMAWGENERGELGTGNTTARNIPVAVDGLSGVKAIAAGGQFSLALLTNGTVVAWGDDSRGQLGNKVFYEEGLERGGEEGVYSTAPLAVEGLSEVSQIAAGRTHVLALLSSGTVEAWGNDAEGELGDGVITQQADTPVAVSGLSGVSAVSAGDQESVALLASGTVDAWGNDSNGTLGQGTTGPPSDVPVAVHSIGGAAGIAAGASHVLAFGASLPTVSSISPQSGPVGGGTPVTITGANVGSATSVHFGTAAATELVINSSSSVTATAPAGTGTVNVTVTTPAGTSPVVSGDRYSYRLPPTVTKLSAKGGPAVGGTEVVITGKELTGATAVYFGGVAAEVFKVSSSTSITVVSPADVGGTLPVTVVTPEGTSPVSTKTRFKFTPSVTGVSPNTGPLTGGRSVTITGSGFEPGTSGTAFKFGKAKVTSYECTTTTTCTVVQPAAKAPGTVDVTAVVGKAKTAVVEGDHFTYE